MLRRHRNEDDIKVKTTLEKNTAERRIRWTIESDPKYF